MARFFHVVLFVISRLLLLSLAEEEKGLDPDCPPFDCGHLGQLKFPFTNRMRHPRCGLLKVEDCNESDTIHPKMQLEGNNVPGFDILVISQDDTVTFIAADYHRPEFGKPFVNCSSVSLKNLTLPISPFYHFEIPHNQSLFKCFRKNITLPKGFNFTCKDSKYSIIHPKWDYHSSPQLPSLASQKCSPIPFQVNKNKNGIHFLNFSTGVFQLRVNVTRECHDCYINEGRCRIDSKQKFYCSKAKTGNGSRTFRLGLELVCGGALLIVVLAIYIIWHRKKKRHTSPSFNSRYTASDASSKSELEVGSAYFGVPIFSYSHLSEATDNFSHEKELGNGGFGTVYYAKLRDGREVAVKRLYENNYKRVEQFMNEVKILTRLRHRNLVTLYGCTSRHSQEGLLLVYEYIPNGTVADHLHGDRAKPGSLTWPIRMKIAIETASALAYLHACKIIHRDVKTNNILLDKNFCVKVADFGLSRLFPTNVTHISTAPQGSPGYVDPEYHQCYQLTEKSDVYSFGVVLVELISSMPAVDITRHRDEINLANLAVNRIQKCAIDELIDPCLGYQLDEEVKRMTTSVAELAFLCLQQNKEMRPSMKVVSEELKRIESGEILKWDNLKEGNDDNEELKSIQPPGTQPGCDESALLKPLRVPSSPISVTGKWVSSNTTSNVSS